MGGSSIRNKADYNYEGVRSNAISVTRGGVSNFLPEKCYVTFEWPSSVGPV